MRRELGLTLAGRSFTTLELSDAIISRSWDGRVVGEPLYVLKGLIGDFDVYDHELADAGYYYHFELYRHGRLARRLMVEEQVPWSPKVYVREDIGERLPGEPTPSGRIPSRDEEAPRFMIEVLRQLGALPASFAEPVAYRRYVVGDLASERARLRGASWLRG